MSLGRLFRVAAALLAGAAAASPALAQERLTVFAAASLRNALEEIDRTFGARSGAKVIASFAASSTLARQIEQGAPADVFVSADLEWMDYLERRGLIDVATRRSLLSNSLVLIAPAGGSATLRVAPGFALAAALGDGRLAIGDPRHVPAGKYAKAALEKLGVWDSVASRTAPTQNVRAALALVARGEAPLGIVYASDAVAEAGVRIVDRFPEGSHPAIVYPVAVTRDVRSAVTRSYLDFLQGPEASAIFERNGFAPLN